MTQETIMLQEKIVPILKQADVCRAAIFGSYARGEENPESDLDLLVEFSKRKGLFDVIRLETKIEKATGKEVDLLTYRAVHPLLKDYIEHDQIQIL